MFVDFLFERKRPEPVAFVRDDGRRAAFFKEHAQLLAIISLVGQKFLCGRQLGDERFRDNTVINIAACQQERYRPAFAIRERVDFGRAAAPADPECLPPFLPCAAR